jgi:hypothetical protein
LAGSRQIDFHQRHTRIVHDQRMQVVQIFGQQEGSERVVRQQRIAGPIADQGSQRVQVCLSSIILSPPNGYVKMSPLWDRRHLH